MCHKRTCTQLAAKLFAVTIAGAYINHSRNSSTILCRVRTGPYIYVLNNICFVNRKQTNAMKWIVDGNTI